jgi:hypothetical protein
MINAMVEKSQLFQSQKQQQARWEDVASVSDEYVKNANKPVKSAAYRVLEKFCGISQE